MVPVRWRFRYFPFSEQVYGFLVLQPSCPSWSPIQFHILSLPHLAQIFTQSLISRVSSSASSKIRFRDDELRKEGTLHFSLRRRLSSLYSRSSWSKKRKRVETEKRIINWGLRIGMISYGTETMIPRTSSMRQGAKVSEKPRYPHKDKQDDTSSGKMCVCVCVCVVIIPFASSARVCVFVCWGFVVWVRDLDSIGICLLLLLLHVLRPRSVTMLRHRIDMLWWLGEVLLEVSLHSILHNLDSMSRYFLWGVELGGGGEDGVGGVWSRTEADLLSPRDTMTSDVVLAFVYALRWLKVVLIRGKRNIWEVDPSTCLSPNVDCERYLMPVTLTWSFFFVLSCEWISLEETELGTRRFVRMCDRLIVESMILFVESFFFHLRLFYFFSYLSFLVWPARSIPFRLCRWCYCRGCENVLPFYPSCWWFGEWELPFSFDWIRLSKTFSLRVCWGERWGCDGSYMNWSCSPAENQSVRSYLIFIFWKRNV